MKHFRVLRSMTVCLACLAPLGSLLAQSVLRPSPHSLWLNDALPVPFGRQSASLALAAGPSAFPISATAAVVPVQCPPAAIALKAACGTVTVPLDRSKPAGAKIPIYFEVYAHSGSSLTSAIVPNFGGPGSGTTTAYRQYAFYIFSKNLDVHDLLLIDDRGRGLSGTIDCEPLQHGGAGITVAQGVADCAAQLGNASSRYGTGDVAKDTEAVRAALGYDKLDYFGWSYGGADAIAYATRFSEHLRSIVLDSPSGANVADETRLAHERLDAQYLPTLVARNCAHSPTCSDGHPFPMSEINGLVSAVRSSPVVGDAYDADGNLRHVTIDSAFLFTIIHAVDRPFEVHTGELLAAAAALSSGDSKPLLRLGAEVTEYALPACTVQTCPLGDSGDPTIFSFGASVAARCNDYMAPWNWATPAPGRPAELAAVGARLPEDYFAPFSRSDVIGKYYFTNFALPECFTWEKPTPSSPIVPPGAVYPETPTLILEGDQDFGALPEGAIVAGLFPHSTLVAVADSGHGTWTYDPCVPVLESRFVETLKTGDTDCGAAPYSAHQAVGRFPLLAEDATPAAIHPSGQNQIGLAERKVVTVAVAAATDAMQRFWWTTAGNGVGLRGGTFSINFSPDGLHLVAKLTDYAFANNVTVSGTATWDTTNAFGNALGLDSQGGTFVADITTGGLGTAGGTLHIQGNWQGRAGNFNVTGLLGGKKVDVLVPEN